MMVFMLARLDSAATHSLRAICAHCHFFLNPIGCRTLLLRLTLPTSTVLSTDLSVLLGAIFVIFDL